MFIPSDKFREVIKLTPLVSIDILIENENGEYLFGLRNNRP
ncbi:GDP-mannose mannosyl hydrolase, partial [Salmonella enterica subsp. enterica]|nr:GDP-mannose mannosyl hydrolase [Salmonella enterica subsp. enterica serovar Adelaide]EEP2097291.1 GDP-mannose mannosyl hydrolase [Salmonella enterica subsp. enterica]